MSLDQIRPVAYTPIRIKEDEVTKFFKDLQERRLVRGENLSTYKLTDKPLATTKTIQTHSASELKIERSNHAHLAAKSRKKTSEVSTSQGKGSTSTPKKRKIPLEKRVASAKL